MIHGKKILVVLQAFRAEQTLERTCAEVPRDVVDAVLLVDDGSDDQTLEIARRMGVDSFVHSNNLGYGANQKDMLPGSPAGWRGCGRNAAPRLPVRSEVGWGFGCDGRLKCLRCRTRFAHSGK